MRNGDDGNHGVVCQRSLTHSFRPLVPHRARSRSREPPLGFHRRFALERLAITSPLSQSPFSLLSCAITRPYIYYRLVRASQDANEFTIRSVVHENERYYRGENRQNFTESAWKAIFYATSWSYCLYLVTCKYPFSTSQSPFGSVRFNFFLLFVFRF